MLRLFNISNFAIIQRLRLELHEGLNLLTGETGAGKSIVVDALGLLLGGRGTLNFIRTGERVATVEGVFDLEGQGARDVRDTLARSGVSLDEGEELILRREAQAGGRSRFFVNDQSVTSMTLKKIQPFLIEIHGQGEQQALAAPRVQMELLDAFAGCESLRLEVNGAFTRWKKALDALQGLGRDAAARERAADMLRYQIAEVESAAPRAGEDLELAAEKAILVNSEKILGLSSGAYGELYESDFSALTQLGSVRRRLQELRLIDERAAPMLESCETATVLLEDVAETLRQYNRGADFSPARLDEVEHRLAELDRLKRKYGRDLQGLVRVQEELRQELAQMENAEERERDLLSEVEAAARAYAPLAERLTRERRKAAPLLESRVREELGHLALEKSRFEVSLRTASESGSESWYAFPQAAAQPAADHGSSSFWSPNGADRVEFFFSANPGEEPRPLSKVASGGESSRLMLTLRTVCNSPAQGARGADARAGTLIFDEVDAGIGGCVAEAVGAKLKELASRHQVLCVTHQPQIACFADHHLVVSKHVEGGRTLTSVRELSAEERVGELARMIGGDTEAEAARETARWMLRKGSLEGRAGGAAGRKIRRTRKA